MRIALCSSDVPFVRGGARQIVQWLGPRLSEAGHDVEVVLLPHVDEPDLLFRQAAAYRWIDLSTADRIICFRPPAHLIPHSNKIVWFIHHLRAFYDLWDSGYRGFVDDARHRGIRHALHETDRAALSEAHRVFANSRVTAERLRAFNGVDSEVLYPPLHRPERFAARSIGDEIVCISRIERHKRQHLLVEALRYTRTDVRLRLCGSSGNSLYGDELRQRIRDGRLEGRIAFEDRWITEEYKVRLLADCLAAAYVPFDEDSYGYASLEAVHSSKPVLTTTDAGGVLELVEDGVSGLVVSPDPQEIGAAMDRLFVDRESTRRMGARAHSRITELDIGWPRVLERLLA